MTQYKILYIYTEGCGYCKKFDPVFKEVSEEHGTQYEFVKSSEPFQDVYKVPTIIFMKDGKEVGREAGFMGKEEFTAKIAKHCN